MYELSCREERRQLSAIGETNRVFTVGGSKCKTSFHGNGMVTFAMMMAVCEVFSGTNKQFYSNVGFTYPSVVFRWLDIDRM